MAITKEIQGDLFELAEDGMFDAIAHGCNCFHTMGSGIAKTVAEKYPEALQADKDQTLRGDETKLGTYSSVKVNNFTIINAYTQYHMGRNGKYKFIQQAFKRINKDFAGKVVGIPLIGCGIAGLKWDAVKEIINTVTPDVDIIVVHYSK
jgi:O-acetyl-ADP-ribose deacetylase (regulator of RNase III)